MVTIALKSEVLFAIIGVCSVFVIVCVAAAICYTCQRRNRRSKGESSGKEGEITQDIALTELPARTRSKRNVRSKAEERLPKEMVSPMEKTKIQPSAPPFGVGRLPPGHGGLPPPSPPHPQPRFSQSARLDPQLSQQTFSTFESFYRAQGETSSSVPPSPHSPSGAWPSQPSARRTSTRAAARLTNATLADIALPPTPTKLSMTGARTIAPQEPKHASLRTSSPPQRVRTRRPMADVTPPSAAGSPRSQTFQASEVPRSPRPSHPAAARGRPSGASALASRARSRSVGASTVPPPGHHELRRVGTKQVPPVVRSRSAVSRSLDGGSRPVGGQLSRPRAASTSRGPRRPHTAEDQPRSYFDD